MSLLLADGPMLGAPAELVSLVGASLQDSSLSPTDSQVGYRLLSSGLEQEKEGISASYITINTWLLEGAAADYDCRLTVNFGTNPDAGSAAIGTWLVMSTSRFWTLTDTGPAGPAITNSCTIEISLASDNSQILASETVTMSVEESN